MDKNIDNNIKKEIREAVEEHAQNIYDKINEILQEELEAILRNLDICENATDEELEIYFAYAHKVYNEL
jgi:hypothetical protein